MKQNKIVNLINRVLKSNGTKLKKENEYMYWSPFVSHHKPKLQINIITQKWHCWISNQGGHKLYQLFKKVNATHEQLTELRGIVGESKSLSSNLEKVKEKVCVLPKEFLSLHHSHNSTTYKHAIFYLNKRGITKEDILKYGIGYCEEGMYTNRIIIPSYDENGQLNFFVGRDIFESKMKYRNSPTQKDIIGFDLFINCESFQEMEPELVENYLKKISPQISKYIYLNNGKTGHALGEKGKFGVLEQTNENHYVNFLKNDFKIKTKRNLESIYGKNEGAVEMIFDRK